MAQEPAAANPYAHPDIPEQGGDAPEANPPAATPDKAAEKVKMSPGEKYMRELTGNRYKSAKALAEAKQETDKALHEAVGQIKAMREELNAIRAEVANPPMPREDRAAAYAERLENAGISPEVVGVFQEIAQQTMAEALQPVAEAQAAHQKLMAENPEFATAEQEMYQFLAQNPSEQETFQAIWESGRRDAAVKYGIRAMRETNAQNAFDSVPDEEAVAVEAEREHAMKHGQVIGQKHRATPNSLPGGEQRDEAEYAAWERGMLNRSTDEYATERLKDAVVHPEIEKLMREQGGGPIGGS